MTFIFRNRTIFWDIPKWNRGQTTWDRGSTKLRRLDWDKIFQSKFKELIGFYLTQLLKIFVIKRFEIQTSFTAITNWCLKIVIKNNNYEANVTS